MSAAKIELSTKTAVIDEPVGVYLSGFPPGAEVNLRISMRDNIGRDWSADAVYVTDEEGCVNVARKRPINRVYAGENHMCLFSMTDLGIDEAAQGPPVFVMPPEEPIHTSFVASIEGSPSAKAEMRRYIAAPEVRICRFSEAGLVGVLFLPKGDGPFPAVLCIGGAISGTMWSDRVAAVLAARGYAALSLVYFGHQLLSPELVEIPIEYFTTAASRLLGLPEVRDDRIALVGSSKGAEAALLSASRLEQAAAVVCYVPPAVVYQGIQVDGPIFSARSSWSRRGETLPFVPCYQEGGRFGLNMLMHLYDLHVANLDTPYIVERAAIPVEEIGAPLLVISAEADKVWPSGRMAEMILQRRINAGVNSRTRSIGYAGAGHSLGVPFLPQYLFGGGTARDNAAAEAEAWAQTLAFLQEYMH